MKHLSLRICRVCFQPAAQLFQIPGYNFATCIKCNHIASTTGVLPVPNGVVYQNIRQDLDTRINNLQQPPVTAAPETNNCNSSPINTPISAAPAPELQQPSVSNSFTETKNYIAEGAAMSLDSKNFQHIDVIFNEEGSCPICSKTFSRKSSLLTHVRNHSAERKFVCNYCHKGFTQAANLRNHERIHTNDRPYMCIDCGKSFTQITNLNNHRRLHTGERPFVCIEAECGRSFAQVTNLNNHMKTHHKVQQYCCNQCPKKFTQVTSLNQHLQLHAGITGYYCPRCPEKTFKQQSQLHTHMKSHGLAFPYECEKCDEKFLQQAHLEQHNKVHDEFKYKCELCPSSFNQDALLKKHMQRHAEGRYLTCPVATCNQAFAVKQHLSKHLLTRHAHSELPPPKRSKKQSQPAHIITPHNTPTSAPSPLTTTPHRGRPKKKTTYMSEVSQVITQNLKFHHPNVHHLVGNTPIEMTNLQHMYTGQI